MMMDPSIYNMYYHMIPYELKTFDVPPCLTKPPAQDSAHHILNALTDECIQRILTHLIGDIRHFLSAAEVCKKFQENAKACFPSIYNDFFMSHGQDHHLPQYRVKSFLSIFGHLLHSVSWYEGEKLNESEMFKTIAKFCGKNLRGLNIQKHDFAIAPFEMIEELRLCQCTIDNFKIPPTLKKLRLINSQVNSMDWTSETHASLIEIEFINYGINALNDAMVIEFQALNPQIQSFHFDERNLSSSILQGIATRLPNLVDLKFCFRFDGDKMAMQQKFEADVMHLSELRHLKRLHGVTPHAHRMSTGSIVDAFADNNVPIEELTMDAQNPHIVESLARLSNLRILAFLGCNQEMVVDLVKKCPFLEQLRIHGCTEISLDGIRKVLEFGTNLKMLDVFDRTLLIDSQESIDLILNLARGRVETCLQTRTSNIQVPVKKSQNKYNFADYSDFQWLKIQGISN